jgi:hypothetical protein
MKTLSPISWKALAIGTLLTLLVALSVSARALAVEPWPELPLPPEGDAQWIAQNMRVNGVPTRVLQFQSRASRADVVAYYQAHWTGGYEHKPSIHPLGDSTVVGQVHGPYLMTLKVTDAPGGASGVLAVAQVIGSKPDHDAGELPMLGGAHVVSVVESDDPGKHSRQVVVSAPQAATIVADFYQTSLTNAGWRTLQTNDLSRTSAGSAGTILVFGDGDREMQMQIVASRRGRGSLVLANLVTKDTEPDAR